MSRRLTTIRASRTEEGNCKYPGDCGGGIHLNGIEHSVVAGLASLGTPTASFSRTITGRTPTT